MPDRQQQPARAEALHPNRAGHGGVSQRVVVLGSTGSIGVNTLDVVAGLGEEFTVWGLSAHRSVETVIEQAGVAGAARVVVSDAGAAITAANWAKLTQRGTALAVGPAALVDLAGDPQADIVVCGIVGAAGLAPALAAVRAGKRTAIANKEPLVMAGHVFTATAAASGAELVPVDSEHSAIFQCLQGLPGLGRHPWQGRAIASQVRKLILTASGGPLRTVPREALAQVGVEQALQHPNWRMGPKITIDSATMMNKALEIIEARWLFGLPAEQIEVVVHPESIIHSAVEFVDGSVVAQMGPPDMRGPIQYALTHPRRRAGRTPALDLAGLGQLRFEKPDPVRFPALELGYRVAAMGGTAGAVLNAANEVAVEAFLAGQIGFVRITEVVGEVLASHTVAADPDLAACQAADSWARQTTRARLGLPGA